MCCIFVKLIVLCLIFDYVHICGTSYGSYTLDQSISGIVGCFINPTCNTGSTDNSGALYPFVTAWYFNQVSDTQINVAWANLGTFYEGIPAQVQYIAFV